MIELDWEECDNKLSVRRCKVPGGWVLQMQSLNGGGLTFVPDPEHAWV